MDASEISPEAESNHLAANLCGYHRLASALSTLVDGDGAARLVFGEAMRTLTLSDRQKQMEAEVLRHARQIAAEAEFGPTSPLMECGLTSLQVLSWYESSGSCAIT